MRSDDFEYAEARHAFQQERNIARPEYILAWQKTSPKHKEYMQKWNQSEEHKSYISTWNSNNKERIAKYNKKHREFLGKELQIILGDTCLICKSMNHIQRHHINPLLKGRSEHPSMKELERALNGEVVHVCRGCHLLISNLKRLAYQGYFDAIIELTEKSVPNWGLSK